MFCFCLRILSFITSRKKHIPCNLFKFGYRNKRWKYCYKSIYRFVYNSDNQATHFWQFIQQKLMIYICQRIDIITEDLFTLYTNPNEYVKNSRKQWPNIMNCVKQARLILAKFPKPNTVRKGCQFDTDSLVSCKQGLINPWL